MFPSIGEYTSLFSLNKSRLKLTKPDTLIMHPGPINRGVEIDSDIADCERSLILEQVTNGLAVRMAVLFLISGGVLAPFAQVVKFLPRPSRLANAVVERAIEVPTRSGRYVIPSRVYGNGLEVDEDTVTGLRSWSRGASASPQFLVRRLPTLSRLGIVS